MALAKDPGEMIGEVADQGRGPNGRTAETEKGVASRRVRTSSPPQQHLLRTALDETEWKLYTWLLDACELACASDRTWQILRRLMLDQFNKQTETRRKLINSIAGLTKEQILDAAFSGEARLRMDKE